MRAFYDDEELMLKDMASNLAAEFAIQSPGDLDRADRGAMWKRLGSSGLLGLRLRSDGEHPDASGVDVQVVAAALAGSLAQAPFLESAALVVELLATAEPQLAPAAADGSERYGLLLSADLAGLATADAVADGLAVGWGVEEAKFGLFLDGDRVARVRLPASGATGYSVDLTRPLRPATAKPGTIEQLSGRLSEDTYAAWLALALVGVCADAQGAMLAAVRLAVEYAKQRSAFGHAIGSFQALQHIMADDYVIADALETTTNFAAWSVDEVAPRDALLAARTAKAYLGQAGLKVVEDVMQVLGGVGQTWEHVAHVYTRRVLLNRQLFGGERVQLTAIADARLGRRAENTLPPR